MLPVSTPPNAIVYGSGMVPITAMIRAGLSQAAITTDILVGFPAESEADFEDTCSLVREVEFDQAYLFRYSERRDTPAAAMPGQLPEPVREERHQRRLDKVNALDAMRPEPRRS